MSSPRQLTYFNTPVCGLLSVYFPGHGHQIEGQTISLELHGQTVVRTRRGPRHLNKEQINEAASQTAFQAQLDADQLLVVLALGRCRHSFSARHAVGCQRTHN